jgi:hypothetical protein
VRQRDVTGNGACACVQLLFQAVSNSGNGLKRRELRRCDSGLRLAR